METSSTTVLTHRVPRARRSRWDGLRIVAALIIFGLSLALTTTPPAAWEESLFRAVNALPPWMEVVLWPLQQAGMALAVPVGAFILWRMIRDWKEPAALLVGGLGFGWGMAKLIKAWVGRGRPTALFTDVRLGWDAPTAGLGFPSGHAIVVLILAVVMSPYLRRWQRWLLYGLALATCLARVFIGAHMPLDVVGGAAFGVFIGSAVNLLVGINRERASVSLPPA